MKAAIFVVVAATLASLGYAWSVHYGRKPALGSGVAAVSGESASGEIEASPTSSELAELRGRVAALKTEIAELRGQVKSKPDAGAALPQTSVPARNAGSRDLQAMAEQEAARHAAMAGVDAAFQRQVLDPDWAGKASSVVQQALNTDEVLRAAGGKVECRSRTCRVEIVEVAPGNLTERLRPLLSQVGETLPRSTVDYVDEGGGRTRIVVYLDRDVAPQGANGRN